VAHEKIKFQDGTILISRNEDGYVTKMEVTYQQVTMKIEQGFDLVIIDLQNAGTHTKIRIEGDQVVNEAPEAFVIFENGTTVESTQQIYKLMLKYVTKIVKNYVPGESKEERQN
jgi:hypothetical protein